MQPHPTEPEQCLPLKERPFEFPASVWVQVQDALCPLGYVITYVSPLRHCHLQGVDEPRMKAAPARKLRVSLLHNLSLRYTAPVASKLY